MRPTIKPDPNSRGGHRTASLPDSVTWAEINAILGKQRSEPHDTAKTGYEWSVLVGPLEDPFGVWDYKGSRWSVYDPGNHLDELFGELLQQKQQADLLRKLT